MDDYELIYKLIELGADKLGSALSELKIKDYEVAYYYNGGFHALKEVALYLFGIDSVDFRSRCMFEVTCRKLDAHAGETADHMSDTILGFGCMVSRAHISI
jgi:hypothetical protein